MNDTKYSLTDLEQETHFLSFFPSAQRKSWFSFASSEQTYQKPPVTRHYRDYSPSRPGTRVFPFSGLDAHLSYRMAIACVLLSQRGSGQLVIGFSCLNIGA